MKTVFNEPKTNQAGPDEADVQAAARGFATAVRSRFGEKVDRLYLVGSRAWGDFRADSDTDVVVVFRDHGWTAPRRVYELGEIAFDFLIDRGVKIQAHPVASDRWLMDADDPMLRSFRRDAWEVIE
ncbi:nucleotidyltransferase domain-containing protein [Oryzibacter oryziterrae]|uniref:nucleotidyltransferase domain-containing protein n=1 Tax=Oryzibacter oryziterrae TaxID=2766474 RepID=UPI001F3F3277|nr:nucleotidyltransferase domain-containing protein [Oryzibacter oryziterrae]